MQQNVFYPPDAAALERISGISVTTYRNCLADVRKGAAVAEPEIHDAKEDEYNHWKLMQSEQDSPAGIALWLSHRIGLSTEEIVSLTWTRVDFDATSLTTITVGKTAAYNGSLTSVSAVKADGTIGDDYLTTKTFYTYTVENGVYNLTACQNQGKTADTTANNFADVVITKGASTITLATPSASVYANANTLYALQKGSVGTTAFSAGTKFASYTGVANTAKYTDSASSTPAKQFSAVYTVATSPTNSAVLYVIVVEA